MKTIDYIMQIAKKGKEPNEYLRRHIRADCGKTTIPLEFLRYYQRTKRN